LRSNKFILILLALLILTACNTGISYPMDFPPPVITQAQINEVLACNIPALVSQRYPQALPLEQLSSSYSPQSTCDWAVLATAYGDRLADDQTYADFNNPLPEVATQAYFNAINQNPAFSMDDPLLFYFGRSDLVRPPSITSQKITFLQIDYQWEGLGSSIFYTLIVENADTTPTLSIQPPELIGQINTSLDSRLVQALAPAATNLIPIPHKFQYKPCWDNFPVWAILVKFADGNSLYITSSSNHSAWGGPWMVDVNGASYVQVSYELWGAVYDLILAVNLPLGEPETYGCAPESLFSAIFGSP
jgi:hypothetical protein